MALQNNNLVDDALNSMVRTDYIPIGETTQLQRLRKYYVDYFGHLRQVLAPQDHIIVGRRGTGKTTLLYRALIECVESWSDATTIAKPKSLGIYLDLSKCQPLVDKANGDFVDFEHIFASELVDALKTELNRTWPALNSEKGLFDSIFSASDRRKKEDTKKAIEKLASVISSGVLRTIDAGGTQKLRSATEVVQESRNSIGVTLSPNQLSIKGEESDAIKSAEKLEAEGGVTTTYRLTIQDVLRNLGEIRKAAGISHIVLLIDEFSALNLDLQLRFSTLARKILGNHEGVFLKICAITDNYSLGSSIILQRDLFELPLDLDAYVEHHGSLGSAMDGLKELAKSIVTTRLKAFGLNESISLFEDEDSAYEDLSKSSMGVPRTLGIVVKEAWNRSVIQGRSKISKTDVEYGVKYASKAYLKQFLGACGVAIPQFNNDIWDGLLQRAIRERAKSESGGASHFLALPEHESKLKWLHMFFLIHLIESGRTTKKEKESRNLYAFDYGICIENNIKYDTDKNLVRQQRFAYDDCLQPFDHLFQRNREPEFKCPVCQTVYRESELLIGGKILLSFCPRDKTDLMPLITTVHGISDFTEEEIKIVGAIRSAKQEDRLIARRIADDVGCYVQKVSKFGERLQKESVIQREKNEDEGKFIYFGTVR